MIQTIYFNVLLLKEKYIKTWSQVLLIEDGHTLWQMTETNVLISSVFNHVFNTDTENSLSLPASLSLSLQLSPTDKSLEFDRDFRIRHYAGDVV